MIKKNLFILAATCALVFGVSATFLINENHENEQVVVSESKEMSQDELARKMAEELNSRVANGEEKVLSQSAVFPEVPLEEAYENADLVIVGEVESINDEYMENLDIPFTDFKINVKEYWKSDVDDQSTEQLIVTQDGNSQSKFEEHPLMSPGEEYVLFLERVVDMNNQEKLILIGGPSGKFDIEKNTIESNHHLAEDTEIDEFMEKASEGEVTSAIEEIQPE